MQADAVLGGKKQERSKSNGNKINENDFQNKELNLLAVQKR